MSLSCSYLLNTNFSLSHHIRVLFVKLSPALSRIHYALKIARWYGKDNKLYSIVELYPPYIKLVGTVGPILSITYVRRLYH